MKLGTRRALFVYFLSVIRSLTTQIKGEGLFPPCLLFSLE